MNTHRLNIQTIPSVNFHLWQPCNMRCKFCFATFMDVKKTILPNGHLNQSEAIAVVDQLAKIGFVKITFAGGEPTLCPWLSELISVAKQAGMTTMIVTNGTGLNAEFLEKNRAQLDWIAISIDSLNTQTNLSSGRANWGKVPYTMNDYLNIVKLVKSFGYGLKINTVVSRLNVDEDMSEFIHTAKPERWKILQVLPIVGQNDRWIDDFTISHQQFLSFIKRHQHLQESLSFVPEDNDNILGSYVMVDPAGRFFENTSGEHFYSKPILEVGAEQALVQMAYNFSKSIERGGIYDWDKTRLIVNGKSCF